MEATLRPSHRVANICGCVSGPTLSCVIKGSTFDTKLSVKAVSKLAIKLCFSKRDQTFSSLFPVEQLQTSQVRFSAICQDNILLRLEF